MKLIPFVTALAGAAAMAGSAAAEMDYHGFDPETIDALNAAMEEPLTSEILGILSGYTDIEACGGEAVANKIIPEGWEERIDKAPSVLRASAKRCSTSPPKAR